MLINNFIELKKDGFLDGRNTSFENITFNVMNISKEKELTILRAAVKI